MVAALYRRYRPETFSEMIGQSQVTDPLMTALRTGRVGHAYLFSGPRGCGKTTSARILARCLNCVEGPTDTPCGQCDSCVELGRDGGGSLDVVEIDAASHGGVDDARDLRERAAFAPARDTFKIFIIDEAHMVSSQGFNALLKIVEEPPPHVKFIFATTEPEKVIGTIRSRTHHYPFRLIAPGTLIDYVQHLCESEGVQVEPGVLPLVVRAGGGSVRDTLSILDQLIAGSEDALVTADRAAGLLGFTSAEVLDDVVAALGSRDAAAAFTASDRVIQTGQDPRRFVEDLLERLRDLIVVGATTVDGAAAVFRGVPQDQLNRMFEQSQGFGRAELSRAADIVSETLDAMTGATAPRLQLELMIARTLVELGDVPAHAPKGATPIPTSDPQPAVDRPEKTVPSAVSTEPPAMAPASAPAPAPNAAETAASVREFLREESSAAPQQHPANTEPHPNAARAAFGRPISDVLSSKEIAGMGDDGALQESPASPTPEAAPTQRVEPLSTDDGMAGGASSEAANGPAPQPSLDDLLEIWPDLIEEMQQRDEAAFEAVRAVTPVSLDGDILGVGVHSRSELEAFKAAGADPLREAILSETGITVKYVPKQLQREARDAPQSQQASDSDSEEPHRGTNAGDTPGKEAGPEAKAEARLSAFGPPHPAPAWSDPEPDTSGPDLPDDAPAPAPPETTQPSTPAESPDEPQASEPTFTRYGEAVVREVLGARFVEERPLPTQEDS